MLVLLELQDGERYRRIRAVHRASNVSPLRYTESRLKSRGKDFLMLNPTDMDAAQRTRLLESCNGGNRKYLVDIHGGVLVTPEEAEAGTEEVYE